MIATRADQIEDHAAFAKQRADLASLNAADLCLVRADRKHGGFIGFAQLLYIVALAIEQSPANAGRGSVLRHPHQGCAHGSAHNSIGAQVFCRLNDLEQLLALGNGIIVCIEDFYVHTQTVGHIPSGSFVLLLIRVLFHPQGNEKLKFFHCAFLQIR